MKQYDYKGRIYLVTNCTLEDIPSHIERVLSYWETANVDVEEQTAALEKAVNEGTAFKLVDDNDELQAVIYYTTLKRHKGQSNLLWFKDKRMFAILCYYLRLTANMHFIYFLPHTKDFIPFQFIVQDNSIRHFHSHGTPLEINLYSKKSQYLYEDHYLRHNIREL